MTRRCGARPERDPPAPRGRTDATVGDRQPSSRDDRGDRRDRRGRRRCRAGLGGDLLHRLLRGSVVRSHHARRLRAGLHGLCRRHPVSVAADLQAGGNPRRPTLPKRPDSGCCGEVCLLGMGPAFAAAVAMVLWTLLAPPSVPPTVVTALSVTGMLTAFISPIQDHVRFMLHIGRAPGARPPCRVCWSASSPLAAAAARVGCVRPLGALRCARAREHGLAVRGPLVGAGPCRPSPGARRVGPSGR